MADEKNLNKVKDELTGFIQIIIGTGKNAQNAILFIALLLLFISIFVLPLYAPLKESDSLLNKVFTLIPVLIGYIVGVSRGGK